MAHLLDDAYLRPFEGAIRGRAERAEAIARRTLRKVMKKVGFYQV